MVKVKEDAEPSVAPGEQVQPEAATGLAAEAATGLAAENEELLAMMAAMAEKAPEPGTLHTKDVIHRGNAEAPVPIMASHLTSAGYRQVYDTQSGQPSRVNVNMLPAILRKRREDGTLIFGIRPPKVVPVRTAFKCLLHSDDPNRTHYAELGFPTCPKANLVAPYQVERHMKNRHRNEWETIEKERQAARDAEKWALEKVILERIARESPVPA